MRSIFPAKDDAPLPVDTYAMKAIQVAFEGFETIAGGRAQIVQVVSSV